MKRHSEALNRSFRCEEYKALFAWGYREATLGQRNRKNVELLQLIDISASY